MLETICPGCDKELIARCGNIRMHHWAHPAGSVCDHWWENETEWHRKWKDQFPDDWQEIVHIAENGQRHIADVKTDQGWVLEFQHSMIDLEKRKTREVFYKKLIWVVDGTRRKKDIKHFLKAWQQGSLVYKKWIIKKIALPGTCVLLRDWYKSNVPVFFDFAGCNKQEEDQPTLFESSEWKKPIESNLWLLIQVIDEIAYIAPFPRELFIEYHKPKAIIKNQNFAKLLKAFHLIVSTITCPDQQSPYHPAKRILRINKIIPVVLPVRKRRSRRF